MTLLSRDQLLALTATLKDEPVLSVYIDGSSPDPSSPQWRIALSHALEKARATLPPDHASRRAFEGAIRLLFERLTAQTGGLGSRGWVGFIGPHEVFYANRCSIPMPTIAVWAQGPHVAPYISALSASHTATLALVDARRIEIFAYAAEQLHRVDEVRAHHSSSPPSHLGSAPREGFHVGTRGGTGRDRLQRALREATARMERDAAEAILHRAGDSGAILVAGTPQHRRELQKRLAAAAPGRVLELGSADIHATPAQLAAAVEAGCDTLRRRRIEREVMAVIEAAGARGPGAVGHETTRWALDEGRVQSLYITSRFLGDHAEDAELLVRSALAQRADVDVLWNGSADAVDAQGGVVARLRYRLA
jgi:hypothetical protein